MDFLANMKVGKLVLRMLLYSMFAWAAGNIICVVEWPRTIAILFVYPSVLIPLNRKIRLSCHRADTYALDRAHSRWISTKLPNVPYSNDICIICIRVWELSRFLFPTNLLTHLRTSQTFSSIIGYHRCLHSSSQKVNLIFVNRGTKNPVLTGDNWRIWQCFNQKKANHSPRRIWIRTWAIHTVLSGVNRTRTRSNHRWLTITPSNAVFFVVA